MRIDQDAREVADGEMAAIDDETDLSASAAASVNLPPTGTHDTSGVPDLPDGVDPHAESATSDGTADD